MSWYLCFCVSVAFLIAAIALAAVMASGKLFRSNSFKLLTPLRVLFLGIVAASVFMFIPIYVYNYKLHGLGILEAVFLSIHNMIRLFFVDGELGFVKDSLRDAPEKFRAIYFDYAALLFIGSSITTVGVILSFFKSLTSRMKLRLSRKNTIYLFSALNESSMTLAKDLAGRHDDALIVFFDVDDSAGEDDSNDVLLQEARQIGAICFREDILSCNLAKTGKQKTIHIFMISTDESDNTYKALKLFRLYKDREQTSMYVFSSQVEAEVLLSKADEGKILVRRVNDVRSLLYYELDTRGENLFLHAADSPDRKLISAVIVGLGAYGTEMLKALVWFCQMDGYRLQLHAFDPDPAATDRFRAQCPELLDGAHNGNFTDDGEAQYRIELHEGLRFDSPAFYETLRGIGPITYVLAAQENDEESIRTATALRMMLERFGQKPTIQAIIRNSAKKKALEQATIFSGTPYDIQYIGDLESFYTEDVIINSELEKEALARHLRWGAEEEFWRFDYNHNSSMASSMHIRLKKKLNVPGADQTPEERSEKDLWALRRLEHRRWNAYMRAEGYVYSGSLEKASRNNLAKMHHCLVTFDDLSEKDKQKDDC